MNTGSAFKSISPPSIPSDTEQIKIEIEPTKKSVDILVITQIPYLSISIVFQNIKSISKINENIYFYYSIKEQAFIYIGTQDKPAESKIQFTDVFTANGEKVIRIKEKKMRKINEGSDSNAKGKRSNERKIVDVIEKLKVWREAKRKDPNNKVTLEKASIEIGIPKKSLDDYYQLMKKAVYFNYPFQENQDKQIGHLRRYIKNKVKQDNEKAK